MTPLPRLTAVRLLAFGILIIPSALFAQGTGAEMLGVVQDESGGVLPGVRVTVINVDTGVQRNLVTADDGRYRAADLAIGNYDVHGELQGFRTAIRRGIQLTVGRAAIVNLTLAVGSVAETLVVTGDAPLVDTTSSSLGGLIGQQQIENLPLNGRNFVQLALLETGVSEVRTAGGGMVFGDGLKMSVNGGRMEYNNFMMDGTSMNSVNQSAIGGTSGQAIGSDAIQEFQVLTSNFTAEFGRSGGGVINVVTKSGTNTFNGSASYFNRNEAFDAANFFDTQELSPFNRNQFGATAGGPILRNRTFFFTAYEGLRETLGRTFISTVPTLAARQGILPGRTIPVTPSVRPYLDLYPAPNGRDFGDGRAEFVRTDKDVTHQNFVQVRVDHNLSTANSIFVRYTRDFSDKVRPQSLEDAEFLDEIQNQFATGEYKRIVSPTLLNVSRVGYNKSYVNYDQIYVDPRYLDESLWFVPNPYTPGLNIGVSGLATLGGANNLPRWRYDNVVQLTNTTTYSPGRHTMRIGGEFQDIRTNEEDTSRGRGEYTFNDLPALLVGQPRTFSVVTQSSDFTKRWRQKLLALFFQDDVRATDTLTVNLGVRWEFVTSPTERDGKAVHVNDPLVDNETVVGNPLLIVPKDNIAPRLGFAWAPGGSTKTSVRGGFGMFYPMLFRVYWNVNRLLPPFVENVVAEAPSISFPTPTTEQLSTTVTGDSMEYTPKHPRVAQYNLTLQRELLPNVVATVGYVGSRGVNAPHYFDINTAVPQILADGRKFFPAGLSRQNPAWGVRRYKVDDSSSEYNALQVKLARRLKQGFQIQGSYTWGHSIDDASDHGTGGLSNNSPTQDWTNLEADRAHAGFDVRHLLTVNASYELPGPAGEDALRVLLTGWQLAGIVTLSAGVPFSVSNSFDRDRDLSTLNQSRPNLAAGASNNPILGGPDRYFDANAFVLQDAGFYGNLGRNTLIGPGYSTVDLALTKNTSLAGRANLQIRIEAFNLLNRANFALPVSTVFRSANGVHAADAGRITSTSGSARQGQFSLKLSY